MSSYGTIPKKLLRSINNNPQITDGVMEEARDVVGSAVPISKKHNATYGMHDFHRIMLAACVLDISSFGYASAMRKIVTSKMDLKRNHRKIPTGEWIRSMIAGVNGPLLAESFTKKISEQFDIMQELNMFGSLVDVALDMHLIPRWDIKTGSLFRSKLKNGSTYFERYITVQCIKAKMNLTVAAEYMPALEDTSDYVKKVITMCRKSGVNIRNVLLDREFFSVDIIKALNDMNVTYLMPCPNTKGVVKAIREFADGKRSAVSKNTIKSSKNEYTDYTIIMTERKKFRKSKSKSKSKPKPEDIYIAFATNDPWIKIKRYAKRWIIETGYRMIENQRVRTRSIKVSARTLCFLYSMLVYNTWVILNVTATSNNNSNNTVYRRVTQTDLLLNVLFVMFPWEYVVGIPPGEKCTCKCCKTLPLNVSG